MNLILFVFKFYPLTFVRLYTSLVRSTLEYALSIWTPHTLCNIKLIESVQHKFIRHLVFVNGSLMRYDKHNYTPFQVCYSLNFLENRLTISDVLVLHKIFNDKIECVLVQNKIKFYNALGDLRNLPKFENKTYRLDIGF